MHKSGGAGHRQDADRRHAEGEEGQDAAPGDMAGPLARPGRSGVPYRGPQAGVLLEKHSRSGSKSVPFRGGR